MKQNSPVYVIEDDIDDQAIIKEIWDELQLTNPLIFFDSGKKVLHRLQEDATVPFLIVCDPNIPAMDGFDLKKKLMEDQNSNMKYKIVPFVFWSSTATKKQILHAYDLTANGFFIKDKNYEDLKQTFKTMIDYWLKSEQPVV